MKIIEFLIKDRRIIYLIAGIVCLGLLGHFIKRDLLYAQHDQLDIYNDDITKNDKTRTMISISDTEETFSTSVTDVLKHIDSGNIHEALLGISVLENMSSTPINKRIKEYFRRFYDYSLSHKVTTAKTFFTGMKEMQNALKNDCGLNDLDAEDFAQIIPFYILKTYEKKTKKTSELCELFLTQDTHDQHLTKKGAIVLCLAVRTQYERYGKKTQQLKDIQEKITMYRQKYPSEIGKEPKNPKFIDEINFIDSFYDFLTYWIDKPENLFKGIEHFFKRNNYNKKIKGLGE